MLLATGTDAHGGMRSCKIEEKKIVVTMEGGGHFNGEIKRTYGVPM
jgi:hypothetical protein